MKWEKYEDSQISEDRRVLKADSFEKIPSKVQCAFRLGIFTEPEYQAQITGKALYSDPYQINGSYNPKNEVVGITFEAGDKKTIINEYYLKKFRQKTSKFYLCYQDFPILIKNKNYFVLIAPCDIGKLIKNMEVD